MNKDKELEILRKLANHYAENGYSKAIVALKEINNSKLLDNIENGQTKTEIITSDHDKVPTKSKIYFEDKLFTLLVVILIIILAFRYS